MFILVIPVFGGGEAADCSYAVVELSLAAVNRILEVHAELAQLRRKHPDVFCLELWDATPRWISDSENDGEKLERLEELATGGSSAPVIIHQDLELEVMRTELDKLVVTASEIQWSCLRKHGDDEYRTRWLEVAVLKRLLPKTKKQRKAGRRVRSAD